MEESNLPSDPSSQATVVVSSGAAETLDRKHALMLERLSTRHQVRLAEKSLQNSTTSPTFESTQSFLSQFSQYKLSIDSNLSRIRQEPDPDLRPHLDAISSEISALEKLVAENSYFLPPYELRTYLNSVDQLKQALDDVRSLVLPRKKFSFKNKPTTNKTVSSLVVCETEKMQTIGVEKLRVSDSLVTQGFKGIEKGTLVKKFITEGSRDKNEDFTLSDLRECQVGLMGCLRSLFVDKLINCKVYVGPVTGSVLIEGVEGCVLVLASHQIRIHDAKNCDFYLRVRSRPIIEDSHGVRFAPYCLEYEGIEADLKEANLGEETGNWMEVDDFRWLRAVPSPNWSILPENERIGVVDVSNLGHLE
ncbi:tubulin-folding cofactor C-like [Dorcoceras hygrometricum]|uniref:Tubulin-folding cofactor C-like n=1 Tax=Dorcoceras hygrometricum TaxID=472368 RepID=A0A2Z7BPU3_9LAMI|nr:tubulin-folding cofactor C-like [Dorcoceras hygrometricum]